MISEFYLSAYLDHGLFGMRNGTAKIDWATNTMTEHCEIVEVI